MDGERSTVLRPGQHMCWELNDMARRLDERPAALELREELAQARN
jgi:RNA polymerase sigma-70 factor (ECF subfamily)